MVGSLLRMFASLLGLLLFCSSAASAAETHTHDGHAAPGQHAHGHMVPRAIDHAPIGVMGDHMHHKGEVMLSYRYMFMNMNGNRDGTHRLSTADVLADFPVAPTDMDMEMHMVGAMWAPSDDLTLLAMLPFVDIDMKHRTRMGGTFKTRARGIGDLKISGLFRLADWQSELSGNRLRHHSHLILGVSFPTGSINQKDDIPLGRVRLPYPMQIGSGTYDLMPGLHYSARTERYSFGAQLRGTLRTGRNNQGYHLGHVFGTSLWMQRAWGAFFSTGLRLDYNDWGNIRGDDDAQNPNLVETADPDRRGGRRLDLMVSANGLFRHGWLKGHRLAVEYGFPIYQDLDGPQLETDMVLTVGWQKAF